MGDLLGSPSVAPSPLFCTAPWGEGVAASFSTTLILPDGAEPDCVGIRGLPRSIGGERSVVIIACGRNGAQRQCQHRGPRARNQGGVYTALRSDVGGRGTYAFLSVFFLLFFSCFLLHFFDFLFCFRARGVAPGAQVAGSPTPALEDTESSTFRAAAPTRGSQTLGRSVSD
jgi:hypothetical protein